jgi:hypothetical protein
MKPIEEITQTGRPAEDIIADLKQKTITLRPWSELEKEYDPKKHPVMTDPSYNDVVASDGIKKVSRVTQDLQRLSVKRMAQLTFGIPVKRIYQTTNTQEEEVAKILEKVLQRNRINSVNMDRGKLVNAACECVTLWFAVESPNTQYGIQSKLKLRCKNYSPMNGDILYPLFDEYGDLKALSIEYRRTEGKTSTSYFDTFTDTEHIQWKQEGSDWTEVIREQTTIGKIPAVYITRPAPIWEDQSENVYEIEWTLSRNGNYIRKNSKPIFGLFSDKEVKLGGSKDNDHLTVMKFPQGAQAQYITWPQATESIKFHVETLKAAFFTQLQLPDNSYESMKSTPMSGEARKMLFIDAQLKVTDESGMWIEALDREINVVKAFLKTILPSNLQAAVDSLQVETIITPYTITDDKDTISNLTTATGGKPIMSQKQAVKMLGWSDDVDQTMQELKDEAQSDLMPAGL